MTTSIAVDRSSTTAEQQLLSIANKSFYHHHHKSGGEHSRNTKKLAPHLPTLTREELTELIKHGLSATIDEEVFMMNTAAEAAKTGSGTSRRRSSHHRPNHHHHHHHHSAGANREKDQDGPKQESPTKAKKRRSAEEIFYATINGEELSVSDEGLEEREEDILLNAESDHAVVLANNNTTTSTDHGVEDDYVYNYEEEDDEFHDSFSFANFDLIKDERMGELLKHDIPVDFFSKKTADSRNNETAKSKPGTTTTSSLEGRAAAEENASSSSSGGEETTTASTSMPSDEDDLSMTDIKQYVMEHLSEEVKSLIPEETWTKILSKFDKIEIVDDDDEEPAEDDEIQSVMTTKSTKDALKRLLRKSRSKKPSVDIEVVEKVEDTSVVSDVTAHTVMVKREEEQKNKKQVSFQPEVESANDLNKKFGYPSPLSSERTPRKSNVSVKFSHIDVRYYERILELNPSVTNGPPIGIGWRYRKGTTYTVDEWEMERRVGGGKRPRSARSVVGPRSAASNLILPRAVRETILYDLGYSQQDIAKALRTVRKLKDQRRTTVDNLNAQSVEEAVEKATTLMKNMLRVGRKRGVVR